MRDGRSADFSPVPTGTYNSWVVGLGTTWDLDLFGRIQSIVIKDRSLLQASYNIYCNLMLSLHARIASEYFFARQCESEVRLLEETLAVRKKQTEFVQKRRDLKFASKLDLSRAKVLEYEAASQLDSVKRQLDIAKNRIALLCGKSPSNFDLSCSPLSDDLPKIPKVFPRADIDWIARFLFLQSYLEMFSPSDWLAGIKRCILQILYKDRPY